MSAALNNFTTTDGYTPEGEITNPDSVRVRLLVSNQAIFWERGQGSPPVYDEPEEHLLPGLYSFDEVCDAVRVRSAVPNADLPAGAIQARVTVTMRVGAEVGEGGGGDDDE